MLQAMSLRKLKAWEDAGLIDAATHARIRDWEAAHARPYALRAVVGLAVLAIGLGIVSVVAAHWAEIPGEIRLTLHFTLILGCLAALVRVDHDALLFVPGVLGLTFFGHLGQVYQTSSPLYVPLGLWLLLFSPLLLARGRGWLIVLLFFATLVLTLLVYAGELLDRADPAEAWRTGARTALALASPALIAPLAAWACARSDRPGFWRRLARLALGWSATLASAAAAASLASFRTQPDPEWSLSLAAALAVSTTLVVAAAVLRRLRSDAQARLEPTVFAGLAVVPPLAWLLGGSEVVAALLFMGLWAGLALAALHAGWREAFQLAVALIALRLVILSFELAGDLLTSGAGLILSGLLILGVVWAALRVARRFAPQAPGRGEAGPG